MGPIRIAITGVGIVSGAGVGHRAFWERTLQGAACRGLVVDQAELAPHLPSRGAGHWSRAEKFAAAAAAQALAHSALAPIDGSAAGVVLGTSLGSVEAITRFERDAAEVGPRFVNRLLFGSTVHDSPTGLVGVLYCLTGLNATLSAGRASTLDAIQYADGFLRDGGLATLLVGGVEASSPAVLEELEASCAPASRVAGVRSAAGMWAETVFGEGAAVFVLEQPARAAARRAPILAGIAGLSSSVILACESEEDKTERLAGVMRYALAAAGTAPSEVSYVEAAAVGDPLLEAYERESLRRVFGDALPPVASIRSHVGDCFGASDAFRIARGVGALTGGTVPREARGAGDRMPTTVLVNAFNPVGLVGSLVLSRHGVA